MNLSKFVEKSINLSLFIFVVLFGCLFSLSVEAKEPKLNITDSGFRAQYLSQSAQDPIKIEAGSTKEVSINFKNTGSKVWSSQARNFVSAYTVQSKYRDSEFSSDQWISDKQTAKISGTVRPGETGSLKIKLEAPQKLGEYKEEFFLASENHSWIDNGYFYLDIEVVPSSRDISSKEKNTEDPDPNIRLSSYQAKYLSQSESDPINMSVGETKKVTINFKNTGSQTWRTGGANFISAYTMKPRYNNSEFAGNDWISDSQAAKLNQNVDPGETGSLDITLHAPNKAGEYVEHFYLASENNTWVDGGYFYLKINVNSKKQQDTSKNSEKNKEKKQDDNKKNKQSSSYEGQILIQNKQKITAEGGEKIKLIFGGKNTGEEKWEGLKISSIDSVGNFADNSWSNKNTILNNKSSRTSVDSIFREDFYIRTPPKEGDYKLKLNFSTKDKDISGLDAEIPVEVTEDASYEYEAPFADETQEQESFRMAQEPWLKVGLKKIEEGYTNFVPVNSDYKVYVGDSSEGTVEVGESVTLRIKDGKYDAFGRQANVDVESDEYIRFEPKNNKSAKFKLTNFERNVPWRDKNFNVYRGGFEYRYTKDREDLYAINKVLLEDYVKGIGETSENPPIDFQKAQAVVSRTYAEHIKKTSKHDERNFDVVANTGDQLYLGVKSEQLSPIYVKAAEETRGYMVTYDGDIVVTPYFGHSNGYTKGWHQTWGGEVKPWLVTVRAEYDQGLSEYGHGVGMSQRDAAIRADEENADWRELLHHYYTDIELDKFYK